MELKICNDREAKVDMETQTCNQPYVRMRTHTHTHTHTRAHTHIFH